MSNQEGYLILELICTLALMSILIEVLSLETSFIVQSMAKLNLVLVEGLR